MNEEDKIIQDGLKSKSKQDTLCYVGIAVLAIFILIPPAFRIIFKDVKTKEEKEDVVYLTVTCRYRFYDDNQDVIGETTTLNYRNSELLNMNVEFIPEQTPSEFPSKRITEIKEAFESIKGKAKITESSSKLTYYIDVLEHPEVRKVEKFKQFVKPAVAEMDYMRNQRSMNCDKESKTVKEDTAKWEKEHKQS